MPADKPHYRWKNDTTLILNVRIVPGAQKTAFGEIKEGELRIFIQAQPKDNEANDALIKFLSKEFKATQSNISIISGDKSKHKVISIQSPKKYPGQGQISPPTETH